MTLVDYPKVENRFLTQVSWSCYVGILEALEGERRVRATFDDGQLEIMTLSPEHERMKKLLSQLLEQTLIEAGIDYCGGGSTTFKREAAQRGLEPDECYWIASFPEVEPDYDAATGPPPDLVIEVEITRSCLNRMGIYRALGVPEVWRYTHVHTLIVEVLGPSGYEAKEVSPTFPQLPLKELARFVQMGLEKGNTAMVRSFRDWLRPRLA